MAEKTAAIKGKIDSGSRAAKASNAAASDEISGQTISQEVTSVVQDAGSGATDDALGIKLDTLATHAALAGQPILAQAAHDASVAISVHDTQATASALNTLVTAVAPVRFMPVMLTDVPPAVGLVFGEIEASVGAAAV